MDKFRKELGQGSILPSGNAGQFPAIREQLNKLGVAFQEFPLHSGGTVFTIAEVDLHLLPVWEGEPFLPITPDRGFGIYPLTEEDIDWLNNWEK